MRRVFKYGALGLGVALLYLLATVHKGHARLTGTNPKTDIWCVGPKTAEVCIDGLGNFIATTANTQSLGSSALPWNYVYAQALSVSTTLSLPAGSIVNAMMATASVDASKILTVTGDSGKILASCGGVALWRTGGTCP